MHLPVVYPVQLFMHCVSHVWFAGGCGQFFQIVVVSDQFDGKMLVKRHRMVNELIRQEVQNVHGLTLVTKTSAEWEKMTESQAS